jgi:hypothetical protein
MAAWMTDGCVDDCVHGWWCEDGRAAPRLPLPRSAASAACALRLSAAFTWEKAGPLLVHHRAYNRNEVLK